MNTFLTERLLLHVTYNILNIISMETFILFPRNAIFDSLKEVCHTSTNFPEELTELWGLIFVATVTIYRHNGCRNPTPTFERIRDLINSDSVNWLLKRLVNLFYLILLLHLR